jgi:homopolymeric O-antigen transport system permease protein
MVGVYADLLRYRELFASLFHRELRARFKGSVLGLGWYLAYPLVLMGAYTVVFSVLWRAVDLKYYPLFLLAGLTPWVFFSTALQSASRSLLLSAPLVKRVRFPRQLVPLSVTATHLVTLLVMLAVLVPINLVLLPETRDTIWLVFPLGLLLVALTSGLALVAACANVFYRDVEHLVTALLLPWFFLTPILYTFESLPGAVQRHGTIIDVLYYGNFFTPLVEAIRDPLYFGRLPRVTDVVYSVVAAALALGLGALVFRRVDDDLAVEL